MTLPNKLFEARTTDGGGEPIEARFGSSRSGELVAYGTWDGATLKLQSSPDKGTTWIDVVDVTGTAVSITADKIIPVSFVYGEYLRGSLSGAGASTSITALIRV